MFLFPTNNNGKTFAKISCINIFRRNNNFASFIYKTILFAYFHWS